jgi:low affinity Fe/Cu permease
MASDGRGSAWFDSFANLCARLAGHAGAFIISFCFVLFWALSGPLFGFSNTWQLVINTATTVLTFLMVFVIQNTINRDSMALHLKLDELLRVSNEARNALIGAERLPEREIKHLEEQGEQPIPAEGERRAGTTVSPV